MLWRVVSLSLSLQVMREVGWVVFDEIHYMRDPGMREGGGGGRREGEGEGEGGRKEGNKQASKEGKERRRKG